MQNTHKLSLSREQREKRRLKAGKLFKKKLLNADVARKLEVTPAAVTQWRQIWEKNKQSGLLSKGKTGKPSKLGADKREEFKHIILRGPGAMGFETDLWTLPRLALTLKKTASVSFSHKHVWEIVRSLGFTPQKPQVLAKERNEKAIKDWKEKRLPGLKKMGSKTWILPGF